MPVQKIIIPDPLIINSDGTLTFTVKYQSDDAEVASFGLGLYYNSSQLELVKIEDIFSKELRLPNPNSDGFPGSSRDDLGNLDKNDTTDKLFLTAWSTSAQTWPGNNNIDLYTVTFKVAEGVNINDPNFQPTINFAGMGSQGFTLEIPGDPKGNIPAPRINIQNYNQSLIQEHKIVNMIMEQSVNQNNINLTNNLPPTLSDFSTIFILLVSTIILTLIS